MKVLATLLSIIFLLQSVGLKMSNLIQLDEFIEHSRFRIEQHGDSVFVSKHYGDLKSDQNKVNLEEKLKHEQLPLTNNINISDFEVLSLVSSFGIEFYTPSFPVLKLHNFFYQESSLLLYSQGLLQPPWYI